MYSNCLFWAYWQKAIKGGVVKTRPSHFGWWPHWMWSPDGVHFKSFVPIGGHPKPIPPPIFRGEVKDE